VIGGVTGLNLLLYRSQLGMRQTMAAGFLQAASLPFIVATVQIEQRLGALPAASEAALIAVGLASVLLFPAMSGRWRSASSWPGPVVRWRRSSVGTGRWIRDPAVRSGAHHEGLVGKRAIVTGGSSGIGQAIAVRLGEEGVDLAINYVGRTEGAEATKDQIQHAVELCMKQLSTAGTNPILVEADVSNTAEVDRMFEQVMDAYGRVDILINNAGIQVAANTEELTVDDLQRPRVGGLRARRVDHRAFRRQLQLARAGVVPRQLPAR
jgi:hypothetical protein